MILRTARCRLSGAAIANAVEFLAVGGDPEGGVGDSDEERSESKCPSLTRKGSRNKEAQPHPAERGGDIRKPLLGGNEDYGRDRSGRVKETVELKL